MFLDKFKGKNVLITGHTGFKGAWLSKILVHAGANVTGYSLAPILENCPYHHLFLEKEINSIIADIRDYNSLEKAYQVSNPDFIFHLAAQPLVRESYNIPRDTFNINVMGTVNILECVRQKNNKHISIVNITTDKVYENKEWVWGYRETESIKGLDPYSNSKSCSELITHSYVNSFFKNLKIPVSTARAGNVIGGGDFSKDRIIPDCIRAALAKEKILIRNPNSIRPYQHVLEPLFAYLLIAEKQNCDNSYAGSYNVGPDLDDCISTGHLADIFCQKWSEGLNWEIPEKVESDVHEANFLRLDCSLIKNKLGWTPNWNIDKAIECTIDYTKAFINSDSIENVVESQINEYIDCIVD